MNANLDVLELIVANLDGADLVAAALVSRAFLAGAIPSLYARVEYTARHAKRDGALQSPFATLAAHDHLAVHVKRIAVHSAPTFQGTASQVSPPFLKDLARALHTSTNLRAFVCTVKILPPLVPALLDKPRLAHVRVSAALGSRQIALLQQRTGLESLCLDYPSWNVLDVLPSWSAAMQRSLAHLTLFMAQDMDPALLNTTLAQLPRLRGLHVVGCPRVSHIAVLKALSHTPELRELSLTVFPSQESALPPLSFPIPPITHLSIDIRASYPGIILLITRIVSRLSPRDALAICGGWIGEIKGSSERSDPQQDPGPANPPGAGGGGAQAGQANDPPLLSPPLPYPGTTNSNQNAGPPPPNPANHALLSNFLGLPFPFPIPNSDDDDDDDDQDPADPPDDLPDLNWPSLVSSFPPTLSALHIPQISPTGLKEVMDRCPGIQLLGLVVGNSFATLASIKASRPPGRLTPRIKSHTLKVRGVRPEVNALASILSRARVLRELIIDPSGADLSADGNNPEPKSDMLLTPSSVRMLMRESPCLRRIVAEGRLWESPTPSPSSPLPFPRCLDIKLRLTQAPYGPSTGGSHGHSSPSFGSHGGGYGQLEASNDHWFWLTDSASKGS